MSRLKKEGKVKQTSEDAVKYYNILTKTNRERSKGQTQKRRQRKEREVIIGARTGSVSDRKQKRE